MKRTTYEVLVDDLLEAYDDLVEECKQHDKALRNIVASDADALRDNLVAEVITFGKNIQEIRDEISEMNRELSVIRDMDNEIEMDDEYKEDLKQFIGLEGI